jgi:micrococcal nuclease
MQRCLFILFVFLSSCPLLLHGQIKHLQGKVIKIMDGDTFDLIDSAQKVQRIRLYGIDCPENGQDFSQVAKRFVSDRILQQYVDVHVFYLDRYKRAVGKVMINAEELNVTLLQKGFAWHYLAYDQSEKYANAQADAKKLKLGLWIQPNATPPWEYRQLKKGKRSTASK